MLCKELPMNATTPKATTRMMQIIPNAMAVVLLKTFFPVFGSLILKPSVVYVFENPTDIRFVKNSLLLVVSMVPSE
jgi:hypothetical protein